MPTPPSTTDDLAAPPMSRLAPTLLRWPDARDDRHRTRRVDPVRDPADVVVRGMDGARDPPRVPLALLANVQDLERGVGREAGEQVLGPQPRHLPHVAALLAPARHSAGEMAGDAAHPDRRRQAGRAQAVGVVAADEDDLLAGLGDPQLGAEAGAQVGDQHRAGDVGLGELEVGAHVDQQRPLAPIRSTSRADRGRLDPGGEERPRLRATMSPKRGGCGPRPASARSTKPSSLASDRIGLWPSSKPIVDEIFWSMSGPPHIEPPRCPARPRSRAAARAGRP